MVTMAAFSILAIMVLAGRAGAETWTIASPAFAAGRPIPAKYGKAHENLSPPLKVSCSSGTTAAKSLVLIVDDPDAPAGLWTHWLLWNWPLDGTLREGEVPSGAVQGRNSFGHARYDGPVPPSGTHRYFFHLYALDRQLDLPAGADRAALEAAMRGHVVGTAETWGTFQAGG